MEINLLGQAVTLVVPPSYAVRWECAALVHVSMLRARSAALGLTLPQPMQKRLKLPTLVACGYSLAVYGGAVFDALAAAGVKMDDVLAVGAVALDVVTDGLVTEADVRAAEDFSEAPGKAT